MAVASAVDPVIMVVDTVAAVPINIIVIMILVVVDHHRFMHAKVATFRNGHANEWDHQKVYRCQLHVV